MVQGEVSEADTLTIQLGANQTNERPTSIITHFYAKYPSCAATLPIYPGLGQALGMLPCIPSGFHSVTVIVSTLGMIWN